MEQQSRVLQAQLTKASCTLSDAGNYTVSVSNSCTPEITSPAANVTVNAVCISVTDVSIGGTTAYTEGETISLTANINPANATAITYQWYKDGTAISGATSATYTKASCTLSDAGNYTVSVSNSCTPEITSPAANVTVNAACISVTDVSIGGTTAYTEGGTISLTANINPANATAITYQWYKDGTAITGATSATYTKSSCALSDAGSYTVRVTNSCTPEITSPAASITVTSVCIPVTGVSIGGTTGYNEGGTISLSANITPANATGVSYIWYKNGTPIPGATGATYTKTSCISSDAGSYTVRVTNSCSSEINSSPSNVTVTTSCTTPTVVTTGASRCGAGTVTLNALATNGIIYWYTASSGGTLVHTGTSYTRSVTSTTTYYVEAVDGTCKSARKAVTATVNPLPAAPSVTASVTAAPSTTFALQATAPAGCTIDWYTTSTGGTAIGTGSSYSVNGGRTTGTYEYYAAARNITTGCVSASRSKVTVNVTAPTCNLGSAKINMSGTAPIRPLTIMHPSKLVDPPYKGAGFYVTGLANGATVSGWRIVDANGKEVATLGAVSNFDWIPDGAPGGTNKITVIATVKCPNGASSELKLETSYGSTCTVVGELMREALGHIIYKSGSGYVACAYGKNGGWVEKGYGCDPGYTWASPSAGCTKR